MQPLHFNDEDLCLSYSKLHLAALESLLEAHVYCPIPSQRNVVSAQHLSTMVVNCQEEISRVLKTYYPDINILLAPWHLVANYERVTFHCSASIDDDSPSSPVQLALERLAQFIQIALHANCIYGNKRKYNG